eukprot:TRINITY_DN22663_c0_g1_i11.p1 TRINITY_DN22663_c0_g1~~TRINITY_DN22663_c0_g1_i11.p1  ORF type:complete len:601 (-),score=50.87 TRINITY_DN22663_c0_g1_i11:588-2390(-)
MSDYSYILVEQYASEILDFSSQYGSDKSVSYTAHNLTGRPNKFPSYGDFSQTYVMRDYGPWWAQSNSGKIWRQPIKCTRSRENPRASNFVDIKYEHAVYPIRIHIYETFNPGGVSGIWAGNCRGDWKLLWDTTMTSTPQQVVSQRPRIFSPPLQQTHFITKLIRIEFDQSELPYYTEIDAVALLGTLEPISWEAKVTAMLPPSPGPLLQKIIDRKLHILPADGEQLEDNIKLLSRHSIREFTKACREREVSPPGSDLGDFEFVPEEIVLKILGYLDLKSLVRLSAVSTKFHTFAQDSFLYGRIDLRDIFYCVSSATMQWLLPKCSNLQELDLSWCGNYGKLTPAMLQEFLKHCGNNLNKIRLDNCHVATGQVLQSLVKHAPKISDISLANCHLLNMVDFQILCSLTKLESLNLYRTVIGQPAIISILCNNRNLKHLSLACCSNIDGDEVCMYLSHCQPHLETIDFWRCNTITERGIGALSHCSKLRDLDLGWCLSIQGTSGALAHLVECCPDIERLYITAHRQTGDREVRAISGLKKLEQLDILGNRNVTLVTIQDLLTSAQTLRLLDISFCDQLGDGNVNQLRQDFPRVDIKWSFADNQ